jgi:lipoprotein-anchoring transpeptidase ErfK/SrfK
MSRFARWLRGGRGLIFPGNGLQPQFLRDNRRFLSKNTRMFRPFLPLLCLTVATVSGAGLPQMEIPNTVVVSVKDQKLMLLQNGKRVAVYPVSTSKYGVGDYWGHMTTPLGYLQVAAKIGDHAPVGAVFHNRRFTGEILQPNAPGRDPVITRIIWLRGLEQQNAHAFARCIYIHGTPQENAIGKPASYGCIRMKSKDVATLYSQLPIGALVQIVDGKLPGAEKAKDPVLLTDTPASKPANGLVTSGGGDHKPVSTTRKSATALLLQPHT